MGAEEVELLQVVLVDDEAPARNRLRKMLEAESLVEIVGECEDGLSALQVIYEKEPDLVFVDVQMGGMSGVDLMKEIRQLDPHPMVVFVTAFDKYAIPAFEAEVLDYLLKPFSAARLREALERALKKQKERKIALHSQALLQLMQDQSTAVNTSQNPTPTVFKRERLILKSNGKLIFVDAEQIDWVEAEGVYVRVHVGRTAHLIRDSLQHVEEYLSSHSFMRIHRSTIVNINRIKEVVPYFNGGAIVVLQDGTQLKLSRSYREKLNATLG